MTRQLVALLCLGLSACTSPEPANPISSPEPDTETTPGGFDAQEWLADARAVAISINDADFDDPRMDRMKRLADELDDNAGWRRACDTYLDYDTNEMVYDPIPPGGGHWARGTLEVADISDTEAVIAITCSYGAYQGGYTFVHIAGERVAVLSTPELDDGGVPLGQDKLQTVFSTPDVFTHSGRRHCHVCSCTRPGRLRHLLRLPNRRGRYAFAPPTPATATVVATSPDDLPPPSEWPIVYTASN